jgi:phosphatidylglycerol lysyltransferase
VPGGYGVFDVLVMNFMPQDQGPAVIAGLLVFRVIYYWVPLLIAACMLGYHELTLPKEDKVAGQPAPEG